MTMSSREDVDCERARRALEAIRRNRRSQTATTLAEAAEELGYEIERARGKGSHWWARQPNRPRFPIPITRSPVSVGVTTRILGILEKVFDDVCKR
jgi:hypothetical protein